MKLFRGLRRSARITAGVISHKKAQESKWRTGALRRAHRRAGEERVEEQRYRQGNSSDRTTSRRAYGRTGTAHRSPNLLRASLWPSRRGPPPQPSTTPLEPSTKNSTFTSSPHSPDTAKMHCAPQYTGRGRTSGNRRTAGACRGCSGSRRAFRWRCSTASGSHGHTEMNSS